jgi:WD40 repeat protein
VTCVAATGPDGRRSYEVSDPSVQFRGGYGVVFQATLVDDHLGEQRRGLLVSLKLLSGADDHRWGRLVSRSPELAKVSHPNLAAHLEVFDGHPLARAVLGADEPTLHWEVNEWVPGQPLADADLDMPPNDILRLFAGPAEAVDILHNADVAHRDLHPRNLILADDGRLVVIDYDTALTGASTTTTRTVAGTQFTADLPAGVQANPVLADIVAFARCLVHTLAGDSDGALDHDDALEKAIAHAKPHLTDPDRFADLLRAGLGGTAAGCSTWMDELRAAASEPPRRTVILSRQVRRFWHAVRRAGARPRLLWSGLAAAVVVVVALGSLLFQQRTETARRSAAATSRSLAAASGEWADRDAVYSAKLALAAYQAQPTAEATAALFRPYLESQGATAVFASPQGGVSDVQVSSDGRVVAGTTANQTVTIWIRSPGQETRRASTPTLRDRQTPMALNRDGASVWLVDDGWLARFDVSEGQLHRITEVGRRGAVELAVSADGATVAVVITDGDQRRAVVWDARDGRTLPERVLPGTGRLTEVTLDHRGWLVVQLDGQDAAGQAMKRLEVWGPGGEVRPILAVGVLGTMVVTPNGDVVVTCDSTAPLKHRVAAIRLADGVELGQGETELGCGFATDPSGLKVVEKAANSSGGVLDLRTGETVSRVRAPLLSEPDYQIVPILAGSGDGLQLVAWNESRVALLAVPPPNTIVPEMQYRFVTPDGSFIVGAVRDSSALMTYPVAGTTPRATAARPAPYWRPGPSDLVDNEDGTLVADRVSADRITLRQLPGLELVREVTTPPVRSSPLRSEEAESSHDMFFLSGRLVTVVGHQVEVWDVASGERMAQLDLVKLGHAAPDQIVRLGAGPDADRLGLIVEGRPDLYVLNLYSGQHVATVPVGDNIKTALFQASSSLVLVVRFGGTAEVWDTQNGRRVFGPLTAENELGRGVGLLKEPGAFVVGDYARYQVWKVGSARPRLHFQLGASQRITSLSADGTTAIYHGSQEYIGVLRLDPAAWRHQICTVIGQRGFGDDRRPEIPPSIRNRPLCP